MPVAVVRLRYNFLSDFFFAAGFVSGTGSSFGNSMGLMPVPS